MSSILVELYNCITPFVYRSLVLGLLPQCINYIYGVTRCHGIISLTGLPSLSMAGGFGQVIGNQYRHLA